MSGYPAGILLSITEKQYYFFYFFKGIYRPKYFFSTQLLITFEKFSVLKKNWTCFSVRKG